MLNVVQDKYNEITRDVAGLAVGQANLLAKENECCCETKQMIMQKSGSSNGLQELFFFTKEDDEWRLTAYEN